MSMVALLALAAPAAAAPATSGSAVLADDQFKWFYWIGFVLAASLALGGRATVVGYSIRVSRPKPGGGGVLRRGPTAGDARPRCRGGRSAVGRSCPRPDRLGARREGGASLQRAGA